MECPSPLNALVIEQEACYTKTKSLYWRVTLKTTIGDMRAMMWEAPKDVETNEEYPHIGDLIQVDMFEDQLEERGSIIIKSFHRIFKEKLTKKEKEILEFKRATPTEIKKAWKMINDTTGWNDIAAHQFVMQCLDKIGRDKMEEMPAAMKVHHAYLGGLLIHTYEVLKFCKIYVETMDERYNFIDKDVLYTAAILHDIGKIKTYGIDILGSAKQKTVEKTIGHMFFAMQLIESVYESEKSCSVRREFVNEVYRHFEQNK